MVKSIPQADSLLAALPTEFLRGLFTKAHTLSLAADQVLFSSGDKGDGRVDEGLLKASVTAKVGSERILAIFGPGSVIGELSMIDGGLALGFRHCTAGFEVELCQPCRLRGVWRIQTRTLSSHHEFGGPSPPG